MQDLEARLSETQSAVIASDRAATSASRRRDLAALEAAEAGARQVDIAAVLEAVGQERDPEATFRRPSVTVAIQRARAARDEESLALALARPEAIAALETAERVHLDATASALAAHAARDEAVRAAHVEGLTMRAIAAVLTAAGTDEIPPVTVSNPRVAAIVKAGREEA